MRALLISLCLFVVPSCFHVDTPPCSYACADDGKCPPDYLCASDGYCHRNDYTGVCAFGTNDAAAGDLSGLSSSWQG